MSQTTKSGTHSSSIAWREWNQDAFLAARREEKPVLLTLTASWCHWCHVMDQTSYSDPRVIDLVNSQFIPVKVDVDQRPDVSRRYNQGGFPSLAILDDQGNLLVGQVYTPPEQMVRLLEQVVAGDPTAGVVVKSPNREVTSNATKPLVEESEGSPAGLVLQRLHELYDPDFGGFGREPKQPPWEGLRYLMALYSRSGDKHLLKMITTTLEGMRVSLYDQKDRGFFRYSVARDWRVPHYEKMAVTNACLANLYLEAFQLTGRKAYKDVAIGAISYLVGPLFSRSQGLFHASQDASEEYYHLPWKDREQAATPTIDSTVFTGWNALVATTLISACGILGTSKYLEVATGVLDQLWNTSWKPDQGLSHIVGGPLEQPIVLEDHVYFIRALLALHQTTGQPEPLGRALEVTKCVEDLFLAFDGGFYDASDGVFTPDTGLLKEKPVLENSLLAESLLSLSYLTAQEEYQILAKSTLATFETVVPSKSYVGPHGSRRMEEDEERLFLPAGSAWARALDMLEWGPVHLIVVGPSSHPGTRGLLRAALKAYAPHSVVQLLDPERDGDRIDSLGFPARNMPVLYVCLDRICLAPITTAQEATRLLKSRPWASADLTSSRLLSYKPVAL